MAKPKQINEPIESEQEFLPMQVEKEPDQDIDSHTYQCVGLGRIGGGVSGWVNFEAILNFKTGLIESVKFSTTSERANTMAQAKVDFMNIFSKLE